MIENPQSAQLIIEALLLAFVCLSVTSWTLATIMYMPHFRLPKEIAPPTQAIGMLTAFGVFGEIILIAIIVISQQYGVLYPIDVFGFLLVDSLYMLIPLYLWMRHHHWIQSMMIDDQQELHVIMLTLNGHINNGGTPITPGIQPNGTIMPDTHIIKNFEE